MAYQNILNFNGPAMKFYPLHCTTLHTEAFGDDDASTSGGHNVLIRGDSPYKMKQSRGTPWPCAALLKCHAM